MRRALVVLSLWLCILSALSAQGGSIEIITPGGGGSGGLTEADANALYCLINGCTSPTAFTVKTSETAPGAATDDLAGAGAGNLSAGAYTYKITFVTASGETAGGTTSGGVTVVTPGANGKVALTAIPLGSNLVTARKIYRTAADGSQHKLVATLADNTTTTYTDNIADASLTTNVPTTSTAADARLTVANSGAVTATGAVTTPGITLGSTALTADGTELNYVDGVTSAIQTQINAKAPTASPTFTGTVTAPGYTAAQSLGSELSTQSCAGWTGSSTGTWSCSGSTITRSASGANLTITNVAAVVGNTYQVTIVTATVTAGSVTASMGGTSGTAITTATTTTEYLTAGATTALTLTASATFAGTITITTSGAKLQAPSVTNDTGPLIFKSAGSVRLIPAATYEVLAFGSLRMASGTQVSAADGTLPAPSYSFANDPNSGLYSPAGDNVGVVVGGVERHRFGSGGKLSNTDGFAIGASVAVPDVILERDAAGVLGLRNGATAQALRVYQTTTGNVYQEVKGSGLQTTLIKTLTDATNTDIVDIAVSANSAVGGKIVYTVYATNGTDMQVEENEIHFVATNKAGTITVDYNLVQAAGTNLIDTSAGTWANTVTMVTGTAKVSLRVNSDTGLTTTTHQLRYRVDIAGTATVTPL